MPSPDHLLIRKRPPASCWRLPTRPSRQDGRIYIETINGQFLFKEGGTPAEYSAALAYTVAKGWLWKHEPGTYVKFTPAGAELFA